MSLSQDAIKSRLKAQLGMDAAASKITVVGLGVTGISVVRYLARMGFDFAVVDSREQPPGLAQLQDDLGQFEVVTGSFEANVLSKSSHLVVSPGISLQEPEIAKAAANGSRILGDIDLFACSVNGPIVAITGSNGKSTVTTLLGEMAASSGRKVGVGGNLGLAALDLLAEAADLYVLELSSFQLERTTQLNAAAATVLNVTADHFDRHAGMADYAAQKQRIFSGDGVMVINIDDPIVLAMQDKNRKTFTFSTQQPADFWIGKSSGADYLMRADNVLMPLSELPLEGRHNAANALAALALGTALGLDEQAMCKAIKSFKGLKHRMQRVAENDGITWVNDSKATNIGACVAALQGYDKKVILIAGGDAKGADMAELVPAVETKAKAVILMGKDAGLIQQALSGTEVAIYHAKDVREAVGIANAIAKKGDTVLLSPACSSLDQYKNYEDRGNQFADAVQSLPIRTKTKITATT